jgi:two-component system cell cycle response regulator
LCGDEVLKHISSLVFKNIRTTDIMGRFGGEEFFIILSETNESGAYKVAEKLRKIVEETPLALDCQLFEVTVSIGVSSHKFGDTAVGLISRADTALYEAKKSGRNCVFNCSA